MVKIMPQLFSIIRAAFGFAVASSATMAAEECKSIVSFGKKQSITPIVYAGFMAMGFPREAFKTIDEERSRDLRQFILQNKALRKIEAALTKEHIAYIPLKGAVLRELYPSPEMRTSSDIDVLVHEEDLDKAVAVIEKETGFTFRKRNYHDVSMIERNLNLELHFNIKENMADIDKLLVRVWDYAVPDEGVRYILTPEFQIFHVIAHMSYHMVHGGIGIRPFLDLWLLRTKTSYEEQAIQQMCADCGILTFYEKCCVLVDAWMTGNPVPEDLGTFESYVLHGTVFGSRENALASRQRQHRGFSYIFHRVFVSSDLLGAEYPELKKRPYLLPIFQVKRWMKLLDPQKRKQIKKEFQGLRAIKQDAIDSMDKLLVSLGL